MSGITAAGSSSTSDAPIGVLDFAGMDFSSMVPSSSTSGVQWDFGTGSAEHTWSPTI
jgi:hypothetical protein